MQTQNQKITPKIAQLKCDIKTKGITLRCGAKYRIFSYTNEIWGIDYWANHCRIIVPLYGIVCVPATAVEILEE